MYGPAGIPIWTATIEELGIDSDDLGPYFRGHNQESTISVMSGDEWSSTTTEDTFLSNLAVLADGKFAASGWGTGGLVRLTSTDGLSWDRSPSGLTEANGVVLGPHGAITTYFGQGGSGLTFSNDLELWEPLGLEEILPDVIDWWFDPVVVTDNGIALFAHGYSHRLEVTQPQAASISRDGFELTYRPDLEGLVLSDGEEVWTVPTYSPTLSSLIAVDVPGKTITFLRPQTEEPVATFTFSEITDLEIAVWGGLEPPNQFTAFLHTTDRINWLVQDLPLIPNNLQIIDMVLTEDQVIMAAVDTLSFGALNITPNLRILVGDLP